jgi:ribosomal protein L29
MKEFKNKKKQQLEIILVDKRKVLRDFRFNLTSSQVKDVKVARNTRRSIAQVLTLLNQMATQKVTIASSAK